MKKFLTTGVMLCAAAVCSAFNVVVCSTDGSTTTYDASQINNVEWPGNGAVTLNFADGTAVTADAADFAELRFAGTVTADAIAVADTAAIAVAGGRVMAGEPLTLSDMAGRVVAASADGCVSLGGLPGGVYVASTASASVKILVSGK